MQGLSPGAPSERGEPVGTGPRQRVVFVMGEILYRIIFWQSGRDGADSVRERKQFESKTRHVSWNTGLESGEADLYFLGDKHPSTLSGKAWPACSRLSLAGASCVLASVYSSDWRESPATFCASGLTFGRIWLCSVPRRCRGGSLFRILNRHPFGWSECYRLICACCPLGGREV